MRTRLLLRATLIAFTAGALAGPTASRAEASGALLAHAQHPGAMTRVGASDTGQGPAVHADARGSERWHCTPTGCANAPTSPASAAVGFAATSLAAIWISRKRPSDRC